LPSCWLTCSLLCNEDWRYWIDWIYFRFHSIKRSRPFIFAWWKIKIDCFN
jgi:hypothetical protein